MGIVPVSPIMTKAVNVNFEGKKSSKNMSVPFTGTDNSANLWKALAAAAILNSAVIAAPADLKAQDRNINQTELLAKSTNTTAKVVSTITSPNNVYTIKVMTVNEKDNSDNYDNIIISLDNNKTVKSAQVVGIDVNRYDAIGVDGKSGLPSPVTQKNLVVNFGENPKDMVIADLKALETIEALIKSPKYRGNQIKINDNKNVKNLYPTYKGLVIKPYTTEFMDKAKEGSNQRAGWKQLSERVVQGDKDRYKIRTYDRYYAMDDVAAANGEFSVERIMTVEGNKLPLVLVSYLESLRFNIVGANSQNNDLLLIGLNTGTRSDVGVKSGYLFDEKLFEALLDEGKKQEMEIGLAVEQETYMGNADGTLRLAERKTLLSTTLKDANL